MNDRSDAWRGRVLLVEDEVALSLHMQAVLDEAGFSVIGPEITIAGAERRLASGGFDCALFGLRLDAEPARALLKRLAGEGVPFAVVTGGAPDNLPPETGGGKLLLKPFTEAALVGTAAALVAGAARGGATGGTGS